MSTSRFDSEGGLQKFREKKLNIIDTQGSAMNVNEEGINSNSHVILPTDYMQGNKTARKQTMVMDKGDCFSKVLSRLKAMDAESKNLDKYSTVQRNVFAFDALLGEAFPMPEKDRKGKYTEKALQEARKQLDGYCAVMTFMYNKLVMSIDAVLEKSGDDSPYLADALGQLKEACEEEREIFQDKASRYLGYMVAHPKEQPEGGCTWFDALEFVRTKEYDMDDKDYNIKQAPSGSTSVIFNVTNKKTKENLWFLKEHLVPTEDDATLVDNIISSHYFTSFNDNDMEVLRSQFNSVYVNRETARKNGFLILINNTGVEHQDIKGFMAGMIKSLRESNDPVYTEFGAYLSRLNSDQKSEMFFLLDCLLREGNARFNATTGIQGTGIKNGKSFNKRDVATSRMAQLFGVADLFCTSRLASIRQNGRLIRGSVMENAEGESVHNYAVNGGRMSFSSQALTQYAIVQMMDAICGQTDRHYGNMNAVIKDGNVMSVKCFDNNMSFGNKSYDSYMIRDGKFKFTYNVKPIGRDIIKALPLWFVNRIYNMRPEAIEVMLCDVLDRKEIDALWERIKGAQAHIAAAYNVNYDNHDKEIESGEYKDRLLKCPEGMDEDDTLRMLKAFQKIASVDTMEELTNIPTYIMPTAKEFGVAIEKRKEQLMLGQENKTVSVQVPPKDQRMLKLLMKNKYEDENRIKNI